MTGSGLCWLLQVDAFGKKIRDETRPDLGQLATDIERKVELLQGMYKRERVSETRCCHTRSQGVLVQT